MTAGGVAQLDKMTVLPRTDINRVLIRVDGNILGTDHGFRESTPLTERVVTEYFAASHPVGSASVPDISFKASATALNHRCDDWLTAVDHCTRKYPRDLSDTQ